MDGSQNIMLSERNLTQKSTYYKFHVHEILKQVRVIYGGKQIRMAAAPGGWGLGLFRKRHVETSWDADNVL